MIIDDQKFIELSYHVSLLVKEGWSMEFGKWIHPEGKKVKRCPEHMTHGCMVSDMIEYELWEFEEALEEIGAY